MINKTNRWFITVLVSALVLVSQNASATNGYFSIGYGAKMMGMGGVGIAFPQDTLAGALNPAAMSQVEGMDFGTRVLYASRDSEFDCRGIGACTEVVSSRSRRDYFLLPNFGWNMRLNDKNTVGVSVYANGLNTTFRRRLFTETFERVFNVSPVTTNGHLGADFAQLNIAATYTHEFESKHVLGVSPIFSIQKFGASGLDFFEGLSSDPGSLTDRGDELSYGLGIKFGWFYKPNETYQWGAYYTPRTKMTKMKKYSGLLANNGELDIPSNYGIGLAINPNDSFSIALDVSRINYNEIDAFSNPAPTAAEFTGGFAANRLLGRSDGVGFGWNDITVVKLGMRYIVDDKITLRLGANYGQEQTPKNAAILNVITPAVSSKHLTAGFSYKPNQTSEWSFAVMQAFRNDLTANNTAYLGTDVKTGISLTAFELSYSIEL
ncbi:MAG: outer membrane protein transport protein [Cycloclasticus sp.]|nr:outer membrane protein transport protein [Cycloclasticus sp.]